MFIQVGLLHDTTYFPHVYYFFSEIFCAVKNDGNFELIRPLQIEFVLGLMVILASNIYNRA